MTQVLNEFMKGNTHYSFWVFILYAYMFPPYNLISLVPQKTQRDKTKKVLMILAMCQTVCVPQAHENDGKPIILNQPKTLLGSHQTGKQRFLYIPN